MMCRTFVVSGHGHLPQTKHLDNLTLLAMKTEVSLLHASLRIASLRTSVSFVLGESGAHCHKTTLAT